MKKSMLLVVALLALTASFAPLALPASAAVPQQTAPPFSGTVLQNANLRAGPGTTFAVVGNAPAGTVVSVADCNAACDWYQLSTGQWIAAFLVTPSRGTAPAAAATAPPQAPPSSACGPQQVTVNSASNLRAGPGTSFDIVGRQEPGQRIEVKARNAGGDWFQLSAGQWIFGNLISARPQCLPIGQIENVAPTRPQCDPSYPDVCIAPPPPDLDCGDVPYQSFRVVGADPHNFDGNKDGVACEPAPTPLPPAAVVPQRGGGNCDPSYPDVCIPAYPPDLDCGQIGFRRFRVTGADMHGFDGDGDGIGCER